MHVCVYGEGLTDIFLVHISTSWDSEKVPAVNRFDELKTSLVEVCALLKAIPVIIKVRLRESFD